MAVTITSMANGAMSTDLLLSGTLTVADAKNDGTESLAVTVYNATTGATFTASAQVYDKSQTVTYSYANGSTMSINFGTGEWVYQRISSEVGGTQYEYTVTFTWDDAEGTQSNVLSVATKDNVTVNAFTANTLDDLDASLTGTFDATIVKPSGVTVSVKIVTNDTTLTGDSKTLATSTDKLTWTFLDNTVLTIDLGSKTFEYTRKSSEVGDKKSDSYNISIAIGGVYKQLGAFSVVNFPPTVRAFFCNKASDTDTVITGTLDVSNIPSGTMVGINMTHNGFLYSVDSAAYDSSMSWEYNDGSKLQVDFAKKTWTYTRLEDDALDLQPDTYLFEVNMTNRYGSTTGSATVTTTVPTAEIVSFMADNVSDGETTITGTLDYTLPSIAHSPTIKVVSTVNGIVYTADAEVITGSAVSFAYSNGAKLVVNPAAKTFTYTRAADDVDNNEADSYIFELTISVNGQTTTQTTSAQSMAGQRVYDYEPAYPVNVAPGSLERQNTAWPKYVMEIQRIYRQFNDNLNYYEAVANELKNTVSDLKDWVEDKFKAYDDKLADAVSKLNKIKIKSITGVAYHGDTIPVPSGSSRSNCVCLVSLNKWTNTGSDNKYTYDMYIWVDSSWKLTCYTKTQGRDGSGGTYPGYANYLVIDTSTLG